MQWCNHIIKLYKTEDIPLYIFGLATEKYQNNEIFKIIGFVPDSNLTVKQEKALYGIAIKRGSTLGDLNYKEKTVLKALDESPEIVQRFQNAFPFSHSIFLE